MDLRKETIKNLFYEQIKNLTLKSVEDSFNLQFSGTLVNIPPPSP